MNQELLCLHQLYPSLCELAHVLSVDGPVKQRLDTLAGELAKAADKELQVNLEVKSLLSFAAPKNLFFFPLYICDLNSCELFAFKLPISAVRSEGLLTSKELRHLNSLQGNR